MPHSVNTSTHTMSRPSSESLNSANDFPKPAGAPLRAPESVGDQLSPSRSTFSFEDSSPKSVQDPDRGVDAAMMRRTSINAVVEKSAPSPQAQKTTTAATATTPRRRTQYYEEQFAYKEDSTSSARERVIKDAPIIAQLQTNVIIKDEYTLVTDLSHHLSTRYQRPESSIMITVNHSACLLLGGTFDPTYVLTISALPIQLQPTTNKRNAAMIQLFLAESIGVPLERGVLKFVPIAEDSLATNGMTILGDIERLERQHAEENGGSIKRALTKSSRKSMSKSKSSIQLSRSNSKSASGRPRTDDTPPLPSPGPFDSGVSMNHKIADQPIPLQPVQGFHARNGSKSRTLSKDMSVDNSGVGTRPIDEDHSSNINNNNNNNNSNRHSNRHSNPDSHNNPISHINPDTLPTPDDEFKPKIGKRKSIMTMFRR